MSIKMISRPKVESVDQAVEQFVSRTGTLTDQRTEIKDTRIMLRIPKELVDKIDAERKKHYRKISRTVWILEQIEKAFL